MFRKGVVVYEFEVSCGVEVIGHLTKSFEVSLGWG
jgi:hypothetical protein